VTGTLDDVRAAWDAISANDFERFIEAVDPEVEFTSLIAEAEAVTYRGHAGVRRWWDSIHETFPEFWGEALELRHLGGDQVLARVCMCGMVQGRKVEQTIWQVLAIRDGLVASWAVFRTEAEALRAAAQAAQRLGCQSAMSPPAGVETTLRQPAGPSRGPSATAAPSSPARHVASVMSATST
jgi:ketosteroid isomerase-like protein